MPSMVMDQFVAQIGSRIRTARKTLSITQEQLSEQLGFKDRQTLSAIESGTRKVAADELLRFMEVLGQGIEFFTDPFHLPDTGCFSFRAKGANDDDLGNFEKTAGGWIAFWRSQGEHRGNTPMPLRQQLALSPRATFEEAQSAGERLAQEWNLGDAPATKLASVIEEKLGILVLNVDMPTGISGAACHVPGGDAIFVNRHEPEYRRNFDLAHELFHALTWDAMPPTRVDRENAPTAGAAARKERLADNFAGALLMPKNVLLPLWIARQEKSIDIHEWFAAVTAQLHVSNQALRFRLMALGAIKKSDFEEIADMGTPSALPPPPPFSRQFMERAGRAIEQADISVMRLIKLLGTTGRGGLKTTFQAHGLATPPGI